MACGNNEKITLAIREGENPPFYFFMERIMTMTDMLETLHSVPLFKGLTEDEIEKLSMITTRRQFHKRTYVFMEGEDRDAVYFIQKGAVKTYKVDKDGNEQVINFLQAGEMFPHVGFFDETPYPATAEVIQDAELLVIRIDEFDKLLVSQPQIAIKVMKIMGQKIGELARRIQDFISQDVQHRMIHQLVRIAEETGVQRKDGSIYINMPVTNQDFANMVGSSRETINRVINLLKKDEILDTTRKGITIYDLEGLRNFT